MHQTKRRLKSSIDFVAWLMHQNYFVITWAGFLVKFSANLETLAHVVMIKKLAFSKMSIEKMSIAKN